MNTKSIFFAVSFTGVFCLITGLAFFVLQKEQKENIVISTEPLIHTNNSATTNTQHIADKTVGNSGTPLNENKVFIDTDKKLNRLSGNSLEENVDRLLKLDTAIDNSNEQLNVLIEHYDQNIGYKSSEEELSSALLSSKELRLSLIEKFKLEQELKQSN